MVTSGKFSIRMKLQNGFVQSLVGPIQSVWGPIHETAFASFSVKIAMLKVEKVGAQGNKCSVLLKIDTVN